jgi:hypothetical protein
MNDSVKRQVDEATEQAITNGPYEDFREDYRARLRWLKEAQPHGFAKALEHYNNVLVPNIAAGNDAIREWLEYGQRLGELSGPGKTVGIDSSGRAEEGNLDGLIVYLPDDTAVPALALAVPKIVSEAQRATMELLVKK